MVRDITDDDDYDELQDEDEEALHAVNTDEFHVVDRLSRPENIRFRKVTELHEEIHVGNIDLSPPYQRDPVWPQGKQMKLIDSLFRHFYVPPVLLAEVEEEDGSKVQRVVDGKQRLTSIQNFLDGMIPYKDPLTKKNFWYTVLPEHVNTRAAIPRPWKEYFANLEILCIEYKNITPGQERDLFQRVQLGMPLTAAEKLQAIESPRADWITRLSTKNLNSDESLGDKIQVDLKRGRDFQSLAQLVYCCDGIPEPRIPTATKLEAWMALSDKPLRDFQKTIDDVLSKFWWIASKSELNMGFVKIDKRVAPVEFVFIGVLLFVLRGCTDAQCAHAILDMRRSVRSEFRDVRTNNVVVKYLWDWIAKRADEFDAGVYIEAPDTKPLSPSRAKKRKARDAVEEEEGRKVKRKPSSKTLK